MCNKLLTKNNNKIDITVVHGLAKMRHSFSLWHFTPPSKNIKGTS